MAYAIAGHLFVLTTLAAIIWGIIYAIRASTADGEHHRTDYAAVVTRAVRVATGSSVLACLVLITAQLQHVFALQYVAKQISTEMAFYYKITALWSGQEGSLLLWLTLLMVYTLVHLRRVKSHTLDRWPHAATAIVLTLALGFAVLVAFIARPFETAPTLVQEGPGLAPSLQNYWMSIHPPALYLGYVGVAMPFAYLWGALLVRDYSALPLAYAQHWARFAWTWLALGLIFGSRWAYEEIGWGGYWGWDPVENAALMPWLIITATLHTLRAQQKRNMFIRWNMALVAIAFALSIFGTFITRSGIIDSVHSFVESPVGIWFIAMLIVFVGFMLAVSYLRMGDKLPERIGPPPRLLSRETMLLTNSIMLFALTFTVLWGVIVPIASDALAETAITVKDPYYNFFIAAFGIPMIAVMAFSLPVSWRNMSLASLVRAVRIPIIVAFAIAVAGYFFTDSGSLVVWVAVWCGLAALLQPLLSLIRKIPADRSRFGGYLAHIGVGVLVVAIAAGGGWRLEQEVDLKVGESTRIGGYQIAYESVDRKREFGVMQVRATFATTWRGSKKTIKAGRNFYAASGESTNEVGIRHNYISGDDLFIIVDRLTEDGTAELTIYVNPLINYLWFGAGLMALGGVVSLSSRWRMRT